MTPSQLSAQLRHIAAKISNSKSPRRDLVVKDLKNLINRLATGDADMPAIPALPDMPYNEEYRDTLYWYLDDSKQKWLEKPSEDLATSEKENFGIDDDGPWYTEDGGKHFYFVKPDGTKICIMSEEMASGIVFHREDGPAVIRPDGTREWWLFGWQFSEGKKPENWDKVVNTITSFPTKEELESLGYNINPSGIIKDDADNNGILVYKGNMIKN